MHPRIGIETYVTVAFSILSLSLILTEQHQPTQVRVVKVKKKKGGRRKDLPPGTTPLNRRWAKFIMEQLYNQTVKNPVTGKPVKCCLPFMKPVNTKVFTDYLSIVKHPICFETVESKLKERGKNASYLTNESFVRDVRLIFQNCKSYNTDPVKGADICKLADVLADTLDRLLQLNPPPESEAKRTFENLPKNSKKKKRKRSRDVMEAK